ncbi:hypothetical protein F4776DRAFT_619387 [Hypoxylon sp. NC0597]|nr:hypothetical protein F4776DRAFT_619387 [Hypoxylon sp. NC0597]
MSRLLNLPPELLRLVIEESIPEGFDNLLVTCRAVYECGKSLIASHCARKRSWHRFKFDRNFNYMSTFSWLLQVADEPVLPRYIELLDLGSRRPHRTHQDDTLEWDDGAMHRIKKFIEESPYLRKAEGVDPQKCASDMLFGKVDSFDRYRALMATFFLTLLPNIEHLILPSSLLYFIEPPETGTQDSDLHREVWSVMETIRQTAQKNPEDASLGKLLSLVISGYSDAEIIFNLRALSSFLVMPNLTMLWFNNCVAVRDDPVGVGYRWHYPDINSGLRLIELNYGCMDSESISQLLSHTPHLTCFAYSHASKSQNLQNLQWDWDAGAFIAAVGKHVGSHLTELHITLNSLANEIITGVTSMKEFTNLAVLKIAARVFCGPSIESGERKGSEYAHPTEGFIPWTIDSIPPLVQMLPSSLEDLTLIMGTERYKDHPKVAERLFVDFAVERPRLLPNLEIVFVSSCDGSFDDDDRNSIRAYVEPEGALCDFDYHDCIDGSFLPLPHRRTHNLPTN